MARQENAFALLGDEEGDDVSSLVERVSAKVEISKEKEKEKKPKNQQLQTAPEAARFPSKPPPPTEAVRVERARGGRGGQDRGYRHFSPRGSDTEHFGRGLENGYRRNSGGDFDGNSSDDWRGRGRGGVGRGRGRGRGKAGFNRDHEFVSSGKQVVRTENQVVGNEQKQEGVAEEDGWEVVVDHHRSRGGEKQFRNGNRNFGGEKRGSRGFKGDGHSNGGGGNDGRNNGSSEVLNDVETKEFGGDKENVTIGENNTNGVSGWDIPLTAELPKDSEPELPKTEEVVIEENTEKKASPPEEEIKEMTLEEYEKLLLEKRKALEAFKRTEERKVAVDKDLESMQVVEKKREEEILFVKLKSDKDKLKKKDSFDKEEKVRKSVSINEFLKPTEGGRSYMGRGRGGRGRGHGERSGPRGGFAGQQQSRVEDVSAPCIEDPNQFPILSDVKG